MERFSGYIILLIESLSTRTFLLDGGLFSVSRLDRERVFGANFLLSSARITTTDACRVKRRES